MVGLCPVLTRVIIRRSVQQPPRTHCINASHCCQEQMSGFRAYNLCLFCGSSTPNPLHPPPPPPGVPEYCSINIPGTWAVLEKVSRQVLQATFSVRFQWKLMNQSLILGGCGGRRWCLQSRSCKRKIKEWLWRRKEGEIPLEVWGGWSGALRSISCGNPCFVPGEETIK